MGKPAVNTAEVIDDTFAGLAAPVEMHRMGRPDIEEGRPGDVLVAEVARFESEGGFKKLAREREEGRARDDASGRAGPADPLPDFGVRLPSGEARELDISAESSED